MRKFIIKVNGNSYEVEVEELKKNDREESATDVEKVAQVAPTSKQKKEPRSSQKIEKKETSLKSGEEVIEAPIPGNILKVLVKKDDEVKSGDVLLILEAMKMENEIVAPRDGVVASVATLVGDTVGTGDRLLTLV